MEGYFEPTSFLQLYWWAIISLLGGLLVFLLFVQGGQTMLFSLGKTEQEKKILINVVGRKWEFTFTTLVVFGGAFFASFPLFYSTSFGGAYWIWFAILICFVIQAVSYEYQSKEKNVFGPTTYRVFLFINGLVGTFLLGVMVSSFFTGSEFVVNKSNIADALISGNAGGGLAISSWSSNLYGFELLGNIRNLVLGITIFFLARTQACFFFIYRINDEVLVQRTRKYLLINGALFVVGFLTFLIWTLADYGWAIDVNGNVVKEYGKYTRNFIEYWVVGILFILGVVSVLYGYIRVLLSPTYTCGIWWSGIGTVVTVTCLLLMAGWNNTAFYPSVIETAPNIYNNSLTLNNASSSPYTLKAMAYVSIFVPFVLAYIIYSWNVLNKKKIDNKVLEEEGHSY